MGKNIPSVYHEKIGSQKRLHNQFNALARMCRYTRSIPEAQVKEFTDTVLGTIHNFRSSSDILEKGYSIQILHMYRNSSGLVKDLSAIIVLSPDSMTVERSVSTYNILYLKLTYFSQNCSGKFKNKIEHCFKRCLFNVMIK